MSKAFQKRKQETLDEGNPLNDMVIGDIFSEFARRPLWITGADCF